MLGVFQWLHFDDISKVWVNSCLGYSEKKTFQAAFPFWNLFFIFTQLYIVCCADFPPNLHPPFPFSLPFSVRPSWPPGECHDYICDFISLMKPRNYKCKKLNTVWLSETSLIHLTMSFSASSIFLQTIQIFLFMSEKNTRSSYPFFVAVHQAWFHNFYILKNIAINIDAELSLWPVDSEPFV